MGSEMCIRDSYKTCYLGGGGICGEQVCSELIESLQSGLGNTLFLLQVFAEEQECLVETRARVVQQLGELLGGLVRVLHGPRLAVLNQPPPRRDVRGRAHGVRVYGR